ncbi:MAG: hypothetical protein BroJett012_06810 [Betaproteobacteria bacterium]|nr:MAG: hypothetical protein BroJett012_06810 [Betaproteobacteria bacterium]
MDGDGNLDTSRAFGMDIHRKTSVLAHAIERAPTAIAIITWDGTVAYANEALLKLWQIEPSGFDGSALSAAWQLSGLPGLLLSKLPHGQDEWRGEILLKKADGTPFMAGLVARRIEAIHEIPRYIIVSVADITERKHSEDRISRLTRMYAALSLTVETTVMAKTPEELLGEICRVAVADGGVTKAWAGFIDEETQIVRPLVHVGMVEDFANLMSIPLDPSLPEGQGPSAQVMRTGKPVVISDLQTNPSTKPWRHFTHVERLHSLASFPICRKGKVSGVIVFLGEIADMFTEEMVGLLNRMASDISFSLDRMEAIRESQELQSTLEERVQQRTAELASALRELETFSYTVSHDLRAPLRAIDGFTKLVMEECAGHLGENGLAHMERVRSNVFRMGMLMDSLLDLARVSRTDLKRTYFDMAVQARAVAEQLRRENPLRQAAFDLPQSIHVEADEALLQIVVENLLSNAWKYTAKAEVAHITLGVLDQEGVPIYYISDNGTGFDMKQAGKLFQAFERLHENSEFKGTGVGLATVQRIIQRHGGQVWAESAPGAGATFYFSLAPEPEVV